MHPVARRTVVALGTAGLIVATLLGLNRFCAPEAAFKVICPVMIVISALVQLEFYQMVSRKHETIAWLGVMLGVVWLIGKFYGDAADGQLGIFGAGLVVAAFALSWLLSLFGKWESPLTALGTTWLGFFYIPLMLSFFIAIPQRFGVMMMLYVIAVVKVSDMGGFALGVAFGRHKLCPSISPNKSWEGLLGSVLASMIVSCLFMPLTQFGWGKALALGVTAAVVGTFGDLVESRFKRECEIKDSATFMPAGLGGFLDMFDSLIFAPAVLSQFF